MTSFHASNSVQLWESIAQELPWFSPWTTVLEWQEPYAQWFKGGLINASYACVDIHAQHPDRKHKVALHWEGENGLQESWNYEKLLDEVNRCATALLEAGVKQKDVVILYLPMTPMSVAMMLAIARIGAIHSVVFSGFSKEALGGRINDAQAKFIITSDISVRRGKTLHLYESVAQTLNENNFIKTVIVIRRNTENPIKKLTPKTLFLDELVDKETSYTVEPRPMRSEDALFILYTSGTTGNPKGILHSTGGYLTYAYATFKWAFDPQPNTVYWCTADIGWITGHSYVVYAPLMHGVTMFIQEGTLDYPNPGRWWELIEKYQVSVFYTSPTALRMCIKNGNEWVLKHNLSSLKILGSVGEPINPEVWHWYHTMIGKNLCPIVDTWWQTETGGFMIAPTPGFNLIKLKPGSATVSLPGIEALVVNAQGEEVSKGTKGFLVIKHPWPGMSIGILNDKDRFKELYWSKFKGMYYPGDYAIQDADGYFWLLGRADEVLNISGHRIGTIEIENAVIELSEFVEAAAIGINDDLRGEAIVIFATIKPGIENTPQLKELIKNKIHTNIGKFITPKEIYFVGSLPKTRSGKIMRRLLRAILEEKVTGDISTLEDDISLEEIRETFNRVRQSVITQE